jgi:hypothetical protein
MEDLKGSIAAKENCAVYMELKYEWSIYSSVDTLTELEK